MFFFKFFLFWDILTFNLVVFGNIYEFIFILFWVKSIWIHYTCAISILKRHEECFLRVLVCSHVSCLHQTHVAQEIALTVRFHVQYAHVHSLHDPAQGLGPLLWKHRTCHCTGHEAKRASRHDCHHQAQAGFQLEPNLRQCCGDTTNWNQRGRRTHWLPSLVQLFGHGRHYQNFQPAHICADCQESQGYNWKARVGGERGAY